MVDGLGLLPAQDLPLPWLCLKVVGQQPGDTDPHTRGVMFLHQVVDVGVPFVVVRSQQSFVFLEAVDQSLHVVHFRALNLERREFLGSAKGRSGHNQKDDSLHVSKTRTLTVWTRRQGLYSEAIQFMDSIAFNFCNGASAKVIIFWNTSDGG